MSNTSESLLNTHYFLLLVQKWLFVFCFQKETGYLNIRSPCSLAKQPMISWLSVIYKIKGHLLKQPARLSVIWPCLLLHTHFLSPVLGTTKTEQLVLPHP